MSEPARATADLTSIIEPIDYDPDTDTYRAFFDAHTDSVTMAVIAVIARATETDPMATNPIRSVIDPDALEALMTPDGDTQSDENIQVTFPLEGREVTIHSHGMIRVTPKPQPDTAG